MLVTEEFVWFICVKLVVEIGILFFTEMRKERYNTDHITLQCAQDKR